MTRAGCGRASESERWGNVDGIDGGALIKLIDWFKEAGAGSVPVLLLLVLAFATGRIYPRSTVEGLKDELKAAREERKDREEANDRNLEITRAAARMTADWAQTVTEVIQRAPVPPAPGPPPGRGPERSTQA